MILSSTLSAIRPGMTSSFLASGGTGPYTYAVVPFGAGGTIDVSGLYTAPNASPEVGAKADTVIATDALGATATAKILVGEPLWLFCDVIQRELELEDGQVFLWDQKINIPKDDKLYIAVRVLSAKPFGTTTEHVTSGAGVDVIQSVNMQAKLDVNIMSRGPQARDRKEEIILALSSVYAEQQMQANSFLISRLSSGFVNISEIDGAAIPYRFVISVQIQYAFKKKKPAQYFDDFDAVGVIVEP